MRENATIHHFDSSLSQRVRSYLKKCDRKLVDDKYQTSSGIEMDSVENVKGEDIKE